ICRLPTAATSFAESTLNGSGGFARSSLQLAHGQLLRRSENASRLFSPSAHSTSRPSPSRRIDTSFGRASSIAVIIGRPPRGGPVAPAAQVLPPTRFVRRKGKSKRRQ